MMANIDLLTYLLTNSVKKTDYNTKINDIEKIITDHKHDKYINIS